MTAADYAADVRRYCDDLDQALRWSADRVKDYAAKEAAYRKAKSDAWVRVRLELPSGTVPERNAWVEAVTADLRQERDIAEGMRQHSYELIRSRRSQISAVQSLLANERAESEYVRTGPT